MQVTEGIWLHRVLFCFVFSAIKLEYGFFLLPSFFSSSFCLTTIPFFSTLPSFFLSFHFFPSFSYDFGYIRAGETSNRISRLRWKCQNSCLCCIMLSLTVKSCCTEFAVLNGECLILSCWSGKISGIQSHIGSFHSSWFYTRNRWKDYYIVIQNIEELTYEWYWRILFAG